MSLKKILIALTIVSSFLGCQAVEKKALPEDLIGIWKTSSPPYEDRFLELTRDVIVFGTGGNRFTPHAILDIGEVREEASILYTVYYTSSEGGEYQFSFHYDPARDAIRFKNREQIEWTRSSID